MSVVQATRSAVTAGNRLAELHFTKQQMGSTAISDLEIDALDPFLRGLLFTDGTVTRALEVHTLSSVSVEVVDQSLAPVPAQAARDLDLPPATECVRRRVIMRLAEAAPAVWAESYIVPERLPADFVGLLHGAPHGIGGSLQQLRLEGWRELLWFKLGRSPCWASNSMPQVAALIRLYRLITKGRPALLISEAFAIEIHTGLYRLPGSNTSAGSAASSSKPGTAAGEES